MKYLIPFILILFLTGCASQINSEVISYAKDDGNISVYFCPEDNCSAVLVDFIEEGVDCAFYDLELDEVINSIEENNVRLVGNNRSGWGIMHNKFCVGDDKVITGSFNPTYNNNHNNLVVINSRLLANNYKAEFEELLDGDFGKGDRVLIPNIDLSGIKIKNYFCPEDDCSLKIINEIKKAERSVYFMVFSFTHEQIANSLVLAMEKDVEVKGVFEKSTNREYSMFDFLDFQEADVKWDNVTGKLHHKVFIIDNKTVITGSMNPSKSGDNQNDENILIIYSKDIADKYLQEFEKIYK